MSAGHHVPSSGVPGRETIMDTPAGTALGSTRRDETADANDIVRAVKFTINNLPCSRRGTLAFARRVGKRAQSTSFHPLCIIYYFLDLINKTPCTHSTLCALCLNFAPLRERLFLAKAQRQDVRRKGLSVGL